MYFGLFAILIGVAMAIDGKLLGSKRMNQL